MAKAAYLVLENGRVWEGKSFGASGQTVGEVVFTTGMTGYTESLTDPSYHGQILVQTFPLIGNYGVMRSDFESPRLHPRGYVVRHWCTHPSNFRSEGELHSLLAENGVVGIYDVDVRSLVRAIREQGNMNGVITDDPAHVCAESLKRYAMRGAVASVSARDVTYYPHASNEAHYRVVLWDFGAKESIIRALVARGCEVVRVSYDCHAEEIAALHADGLLLSNGPGDPAENRGAIEELRKLASLRIPTFGICLGHQLLALSAGARAEKLKYGHRGANQPVRDALFGTVAITTQNHGYAVLPESIPRGSAQLRYVNVNDGSCEGIDYTDMPAFGIQFHPEAAPGPADASSQFERFLGLMEKEKRKHAA